MRVTNVWTNVERYLIYFHRYRPWIQTRCECFIFAIDIVDQFGIQTKSNFQLEWTIKELMNKMSSPLATSLMLVCSLLHLFSMTINCNLSSRDDKMEELLQTKQSLLASELRSEPFEMHIYLKDFKRLTAECQDNPNYFLQINLFSGHNIDDLIEAYNINETQCNKNWFLKLRAMLTHYRGKKSIWAYLDHMKRKLGQFCLILSQAQSQPEYFGLGQANQGKISDKFWLD